MGGYRRAVAAPTAEGRDLVGDLRRLAAAGEAPHRIAAEVRDDVGTGRIPWVAAMRSAFVIPLKVLSEVCDEWSAVELDRVLGPWISQQAGEPT